jgi:uncharacterized membrane protein
LRSKLGFIRLSVDSRVAISLVIGTIAMVDLRLLGLASTKRPFAELSRQVLPFTWAAFVLAVIAGSLLFISRATDYFVNPMFWIKMVLIVIAGINAAAPFAHPKLSVTARMERTSPHGWDAP